MLSERLTVFLDDEFVGLRACFVTPPPISAATESHSICVCESVNYVPIACGPGLGFHIYRVTCCEIDFAFVVEKYLTQLLSAIDPRQAARHH